MAKVSYTYSVSLDFPNHQVDPSRLYQEVVSSSITIALDNIEVVQDACTISFKVDLSTGEKTILDGLVAAHSGEPMPQPGFLPDGTPIVALNMRQPDGVSQFAPAPRDGSEWVIGSHNFCDPCSWFGDSVRQNAETLTDLGDGLTFSSSHVNWIDMISGRMHNDDIWCQIQQMLNPGDPHGYQVVVTVDGSPVTMREPFEVAGGDYEVDWDAGAVVLFASQAGKTVAASYNYATTNTFYVRPMPGKTLVIEDAEADISSDCVMNDGIAYSAWHFDGTAYVKDMEAVYKRAGQIVTEARGCYPTFEAIGASSADKALPIEEFRRKSRGMQYNRQAIPFQYSTVKWLRSTYAQEVRVYTEHGRQLEGELVTMTFYCTEKDA